MQVAETPPSCPGADPLALRMAVYAACLGVTLGGLVAGLAQLDFRINSLWAVAVLTSAAAIAERGRVRLERGNQTESSISNLPVLFTAAVFGPIPAMLVGAGSMLGA